MSPPKVRLTDMTSTDFARRAGSTLCFVAPKEPAVPTKTVNVSSVGDGLATVHPEGDFVPTSLAICRVQPLDTAAIEGTLVYLEGEPDEIEVSSNDGVSRIWWLFHVGHIDIE